MKFVFLPLAMALAMVGFTALAFVLTASPLPPRTVAVTADQAAIFVAYRNAVLTYVIGNMSFTGTAAVSAPGSLSGVSNQVVPTTSGNGRVIYSWATLPAGAAGAAAALTGGDVSFGTVSGSTWVSAVGGPMGDLQVTVPNGDVISVCQIGV